MCFSKDDLESLDAPTKAGITSVAYESCVRLIISKLLPDENYVVIDNKTLTNELEDKSLGADVTWGCSKLTVFAARYVRYI